MNEKNPTALQKNANLHDQLYPYLLVEEWAKITRTLQTLQAQKSTIAIKAQISLLMKTKEELFAEAADRLGVSHTELTQNIKNKTLLADKQRILDDISALRDSLRQETGLTLRYASPESKHQALLAQRTLLIKNIEQLQHSIQQKTEEVSDLLEELADTLTEKGYTVEEYNNLVIQPLQDRYVAMTKEIANLEKHGASPSVIMAKKEAQKQALQRIQLEKRLLTAPMDITETCANLEVSLIEAQQQLSQLDKDLESEAQKIPVVQALKKECEKLFFASYAITHAFYKENLKREKGGLAPIQKSEETNYVERQRDFLGALRNHLQAPSSASIDTLLRRCRAYYTTRATFDFVDNKPVDDLIRNLANIDPNTTQQMLTIIHTIQENLAAPDDSDPCEEEKRPGSGG